MNFDMRKPTGKPVGGANNVATLDRPDVRTRKPGAVRDRVNAGFKFPGGWRPGIDEPAVTLKKAISFLSSLHDNGGIVDRACREAGITRTAAYRYRDEDPEFTAAWDKCVDRGIDVLEDECKNRALNGVAEPVFYQGVICGHVQRYSDGMLMKLLAAHRAKYRDRSEISGPNGGPIAMAIQMYIPENKRDPLLEVEIEEQNRVISDREQNSQE